MSGENGTMSHISVFFILKASLSKFVYMLLNVSDVFIVKSMRGLIEKDLS